MPDGPSRPGWSVVIVGFDGGELLDRCVASVFAAADEEPEVILVDNASTDGSAARVATRPGVRLVSNPRNVGFPRAVNQGLEAATGERVLVLNPDAVLPVGFFDAARSGLRPDGDHDLISFAQQGDPDLRATTGPLLTPLEIVRQLVLRRRGHAELGPITTRGPFEFRRVTRGYLSGYCLAGARQTFELLGGLDPRLFWAEDVDLSARAAGTGLVLGVCTSVEVIHARTHSSRRHAALVTFFQMTAKIGYARRHAPWSLAVVVPVVAVTAMLRYLWFAVARRQADGATPKAVAYRAVLSHVLRGGWRFPDGWDPRVADRLREAGSPTRSDRDG